MLETGKSYTQEIIVGPKDTALALTARAIWKSLRHQQWWD